MYVIKNVSNFDNYSVHHLCILGKENQRELPGLLKVLFDPRLNFQERFDAILDIIQGRIETEWSARAVWRILLTYTDNPIDDGDE